MIDKEKKKVDRNLCLGSITVHASYEILSSYPIIDCRHIEEINPARMYIDPIV